MEDPPGSEWLADGERPVGELEARGVQLDLGPAPGQVAQRQHCLQPGNSAPDDHHPGPMAGLFAVLLHMIERMGEATDRHPGEVRLPAT